MITGPRRPPGGGGRPGPSIGSGSGSGSRAGSGLAWRTPLPWLGGLLALYLVMPIAALLPRLGQATSGGTPGLGSALAVSAITATISSVVIAVGGIPLAYVLAKGGGRLRELLGVAVQLPLALPPLMSGILLVELVGPYSLVGRFFGGRLTDSLAGIVVAQTFVAAPFLIVAARSAFAGMDPDLADVATTLGHRPWSRFARVSQPLAAPAIRAGLLLSWLRAFGEFGATVVLAYHPYSLPVLTYVRFTGSGLSATIAPTAAALVAALVVLGLTHWWPGQWLAAMGHPRRPPIPLPGPRAGTGPSVQGPSPTDQPAAGASAMGGPLTEASAIGAGSDLEPALSFDLDTRLGSFHLRLAHPGEARHLALLGPSGAGKSLTLRALAGLLGAEVGHVQLGSVDLGGLAAEDRGVGWVPQDAALFPHLRVWEQVTFGRGADPQRAAWWLDRLGLGGLEDRRPDQLSGGQRRRVALARALAPGPRLLLLDEPSSGLDTPVRDDLRRQLRALQQQTGVTTVTVTHDPEEAALLADEVLVISEGRLLQGGPRSVVLRQPASAQVARLVGVANLHHGRLVAPCRVEAASVELAVPETHLEMGTPVSWCVRREQVEVSPLATPPGPATPAGQASPGPMPEPDLSGHSHEGTVLDVVDLGAWTEVVVRLDGDLELTGRTSLADGLRSGSRCRVSIAPEAISVWAADSARAGRSGGGDHDLSGLDDGLDGGALGQAERLG